MKFGGKPWNSSLMDGHYTRRHTSIECTIRRFIEYIPVYLLLFSEPVGFQDRCYKYCSSWLQGCNLFLQLRQSQLITADMPSPATVNPIVYNTNNLEKEGSLYAFWQQTRFVIIKMLR